MQKSSGFVRTVCFKLERLQPQHSFSSGVVRLNCFHVFSIFKIRHQKYAPHLAFGTYSVSQFVIDIK